MSISTKTSLNFSIQANSTSLTSIAARSMVHLPKVIIYRFKIQWPFIEKRVDCLSLWIRTDGCLQSYPLWASNGQKMHGHSPIKIDKTE